MTLNLRYNYSDYILKQIVSELYDKYPELRDTPYDKYPELRDTPHDDSPATISVTELFSNFLEIFNQYKNNP